VEIRRLACFTKLLSKTQKRPLWLFTFSQRKSVLRFFFALPTFEPLGKFQGMIYEYNATGDHSYLRNVCYGNIS
jgi:hypothetical protein